VSGFLFYYLAIGTSVYYKSREGEWAAFGKSFQKIIDKILENPFDTTFDIESLIHGSMKKKLPELKLAIDGCLTPQQAGKLKIIKKHFEDLETRKAKLEENPCVRHALSTRTWLNPNRSVL